MPSMLGLDRIKGRTTWDVLILATTLGIGLVVCKGQGAANKKDESGKQHPSWCRWTPPLPSAPLPSPGIVNQYKDAPPSVHMCLLLHIQLQESTIPPLLCSVTKIRIWASNQCKPLASEMNCTMYTFYHLKDDKMYTLLVIVASVTQSERLRHEVQSQGRLEGPPDFYKVRTIIFKIDLASLFCSLQITNLFCEMNLGHK